MIFVWTQIPASSYLGCPFPPDVSHVVFVSIFLQQVGWERCLVVFKGTLKSGDLPRLKRRLGVCAGIGFEPRHGRLHDQASRRFLPPFFFEFFCFSFLLLRWAIFDISLLRPLPGSDAVMGALCNILRCHKG